MPTARNCAQLVAERRCLLGLVQAEYLGGELALAALSNICLFVYLHSDGALAVIDTGLDARSANAAWD